MYFLALLFSVVFSLLIFALLVVRYGIMQV